MIFLKLKKHFLVITTSAVFPYTAEFFHALSVAANTTP